MAGKSRTGSLIQLDKHETSEGESLAQGHEVSGHWCGDRGGGDKDFSVQACLRWLLDPQVARSDWQLEREVGSWIQVDAVRPEVRSEALSLLWLALEAVVVDELTGGEAPASEICRFVRREAREGGKPGGVSEARREEGWCRLCQPGKGEA